MSNIENFINTAKKDIALIKTIQKTKFSEVYECRLDGKDAVLKIKTDCTFENEIGIEEIIVDQLHNLNLAPQILHADTEKKVVIYEKVVGSDLSTVSKANIISKCAKQLLCAFRDNVCFRNCAQIRTNHFFIYHYFFFRISM